ncbi:hypothetical protein CHU98_g5637 [Xylaria longipes]|nr:hypothetical protein CHU98_g5637 [Xylaria longipes]
MSREQPIHHGSLEHLLPPSWKAQITAWLAEDTPSYDYAVSHGQDVGARMSLEPYNAERYVANHVLLGVVDKLHKLYSVESGPLVPLRSWGLSAVNAMGPLKGFFMQQAAGNGFKLF